MQLKNKIKKMTKREWGWKINRVVEKIFILDLFV